MNFFSLDFTKVISLLLSAGMLTILYELISSLFSFSYSQRKSRAEYLIENLYCFFQDSLEIHLFKPINTIESFYYTMTQLTAFKEYIHLEPKILFYLNDHSKIYLDKALFYGKKYEISHSIHDLFKFRTSFKSFSNSYFKQLNKDRKVVGLPIHGYKYRAYYKMHIYGKYSSFMLFIDYYLSPLFSVFISSIFILIILMFLLPLFYSWFTSI